MSNFWQLWVWKLGFMKISLFSFMEPGHYCLAALWYSDFYSNIYTFCTTPLKTRQPKLPKHSSRNFLPNVEISVCWNACFFPNVISSQQRDNLIIQNHETVGKSVILVQVFWFSDFLIILLSSHQMTTFYLKWGLR